jgi:hypothetical protein
VSSPEVKITRNTLVLPNGNVVAVRAFSPRLFLQAYVATDYKDKRVFWVDGGGTAKIPGNNPAVIEYAQSSTRRFNLPKVTKIGHKDGNPVYALPEYACSLKKSNSYSAWCDYVEIRDTWDQVKLMDRDRGRGEWGYQLRERLLDRLRERNKLPKGLYTALTELSEACDAFGEDYSFQFMPSTCATDHLGRLILLDVVYSPLLVEKHLRAQAARRQSAHRSVW